jgi:hypothetical protein
VYFFENFKGFTGIYVCVKMSLSLVCQNLALNYKNQEKSEYSHQEKIILAKYWLEPVLV